MGFFSSIGKAVGGAVKAVGKVTGGVLKTVAPIASVIPGIGGIVGAVGSIVGNVLSPEKQQKIVEAVDDQGVIKTDRIEETILNYNPNIDTTTLQVATQDMTKLALQNSPTATIDDSKSITSIDTMTKVVQWCKSNFLLLGGGALALFFLKGNSSNSGRRSKRY